MICEIRQFLCRAIGLSLVAVMTLTACSVQSSPLDSTQEPASVEVSAEYVENGLSFEHPLAWKVDGDWDLWSFGAGLITFEFGDDASMLVILSSVDDGEPLDDPLENYPWDTDSESEGELNGFRTTEAEHGLETLGVEIELRVLAGVQRFGSHQIIVQLASPADEFENHRAGFEQLLQTMAFQPSE